MSTQPDALDRGVLERKARDELVQIAGAVGATVPSRAKKADIVDAIIGVAGGAAAEAPASTPRARVRSAGRVQDLDTTEDGPGVPEPEVNVPDVDGPDEEPKAEWELEVDDNAGQPKKSGDGVTRRRVRTAKGSQNTDNADGGKNSDAKDADDKGGDKGGDTADNGDSAAASNGENGSADQNGADDGEGSGKRRRRRRGRDRDRTADEAFNNGDPVPVEGLVDLRDEGYGFLRTKGFLPSKEDCYLPAKFVRQHGLRKGDLAVGTSRPSARGEKNPAMLTVESVNGVDVETARKRPDFDELTPLYPDERLTLEAPRVVADPTARVIDLVAPIGKGQRGLLVSPPKAGKTTIMKQIVKSIEANHPDVETIVLLIDERPEEVTDIRRSVEGTVVASTFDKPTEEHIQVAELTIERAKRLVEDGKDVVVVLDGITRLARAYNIAAPGTGRIMSGGIDTAALYPPKKFFGAACNVEEGGSLTIIATALVETGSRMDEVIFEEFKGTGNMELRLDRRLAEQRIFPAIDVESSGTRHEELLFERKQLQQVWKLRKVLGGLAGDGDGRGTELLIDRLGQFKTNAAFLDEIGKAGSVSSL